MNKYKGGKLRVLEEDVQLKYREFLKKLRKTCPHLKEATFNWKLNCLYIYGGYCIEEQEGINTVGYPFGLQRRKAAEQYKWFEHVIEMLQFLSKLNSTPPLKDCPEENLK